MVKEELVEEIAKSLNLTKFEAHNIFDAAIESIKEMLEEGKKIEIREFGTFSAVMRKPKLGRIISTGGTVKIPARMAPKFLPGKILKDLVNQGITTKSEVIKTSSEK